MDPVYFLPEGKHCYDVIDDELAADEEQINLPTSIEELQLLDLSQLGTIFLKAAEQGNLSLVEDMIKVNSELVKSKDSDGYTALHRASYNGRIDVMRVLISNGADVLARTEDGWQPLHCACRWNEIHAAQLLLESNADINSQTNGGQTALHLAAISEDNVKLLEMLLLNPFIKAYIKNSLSETPYDIALRSGPHHKLFELVDKSINVLKSE